MKKTVQLAVWMRYDSQSGYFWPQVYATKPHLDEKLNFPHKSMRFLSEPYSYETNFRSVSGSFGTEVELDYSVKNRLNRLEELLKRTKKYVDNANSCCCLEHSQEEIVKLSKAIESALGE